MSTNRRILIDNATLSGVERITGVSRTLNLNNIENDLEHKETAYGRPAKL